MLLQVVQGVNEHAQTCSRTWQQHRGRRLRLRCVVGVGAGGPGGERACADVSAGGAERGSRTGGGVCDCVVVGATAAVPAMKPEATAIGDPQDGRRKITLMFHGRRFCTPKFRFSTLQQQWRHW